MFILHKKAGIQINRLTSKGLYSLLYFFHIIEKIDTNNFVNKVNKFVYKITFKIFYKIKIVLLLIQMKWGFLPNKLQINIVFNSLQFVCPIPVLFKFL